MVADRRPRAGVIRSTCGRPTIRNFSPGMVHAVAGVTVDAGLSGGEDQVIDRVHRVEAGRLLGVAVVEPDVGQLAPLDEVGVAGGVVDIEAVVIESTMISSTLRRVRR